LTAQEFYCSLEDWNKVHELFTQCSTIQREHSVSESPQVPPVCPSDKNSIKMMIGLERWWNDTDRGELKYWERNII
jgi:hypothetical protein